VAHRDEKGMLHIHGRRKCGTYMGEGKCTGEKNRPPQRRTLDAIILKWILSKYNAEAWPGFMWFRIKTSCGLL
jgi:hypothetical protein